LGFFAFGMSIVLSQGFTLGLDLEPLWGSLFLVCRLFSPRVLPWVEMLNPVGVLFCLV